MSPQQIVGFVLLQSEMSLIEIGLPGKTGGALRAWRWQWVGRKLEVDWHRCSREELRGRSTWSFPGGRKRGWCLPPSLWRTLLAWWGSQGGNSHDVRLTSCEPWLRLKSLKLCLTLVEDLSGATDPRFQQAWLNSKVKIAVCWCLHSDRNSNFALEFFFQIPQPPTSISICLKTIDTK